MKLRRPLRAIALPLLAFTLGLAPLPAQERTPLKVYISADMEGHAGVVSDRQVGSNGAEYGLFRTMMTEEVNAAVQGALDAGATEIVVSDAHGSGQNILYEALRPEAKLVRGQPRPGDMMEGLDSTFDAAVFVGYHAGETSPEGTLAHTMSGGRFLSIKVNGQDVSESTFNAALAGDFRVPVVLVTGDDAMAEETRALLPDVEAAVVKWAFARQAAMSLGPDSARALIRRKTALAIRRRGEMRPFVVPGPVTLEIAFKGPGMAELVAFFPTVERVGTNVVRVQVADIRAAARFLLGVMYLSG